MQSPPRGLQKPKRFCDVRCRHNWQCMNGVRCIWIESTYRWVIEPQTDTVGVWLHPDVLAPGSGIWPHFFQSQLHSLRGHQPLVCIPEELSGCNESASVGGCWPIDIGVCQSAICRSVVPHRDLQSLTTHAALLTTVCCCCRQWAKTIWCNCETWSPFCVGITKKLTVMRKATYRKISPEIMPVIGKSAVQLWLIDLTPTAEQYANLMNTSAPTCWSLC